MHPDKISIGYFADGPWSHLAFEKLIEDNSIEIKFIVPRSDTKDLTLKKYSDEYNIDYLYPVKINSTSFFDTAESYDCDLFVSMSFNQIFRKKIIELPRLGTINCHAGKLPFYRGRNILNWALINDEKEFGITVHYIDEGIDTGDIIVQKCFPITDQDDYGSLLGIAYKECANILYEGIKLIQSGLVKPIMQNEIHLVGFYCGRREVGDEIINWRQSSRDIFNFIRALCAPGPSARSISNDDIIKINKARMVENAPIYKNTPGQILAKTEIGYLVKTKDSFVEIYDIESKTNLRVGEKLK